MEKHSNIFLRKIAWIILLLLCPILVQAQSPQRIIVRLDNRVLADTVISSTDTIVFIDFLSSIALANPQHPVSTPANAPVENSALLQKTPKAKNNDQNNARMQCMATTKKGTRCSRMAQPGSKYCWQHAH